MNVYSEFPSALPSSRVRQQLSKSKEGVQNRAWVVLQPQIAVRGAIVSAHEYPSIAHKKFCCETELCVTKRYLARPKVRGSSCICCAANIGLIGLRTKRRGR